ncbi:neural cell adhesion molecule 2 [Glossina fuscipes]|uniref:Neural cell adhesion molecule 2 n=3 Tax=Glossina TaxID=7393 RepID=A0A8U0WEK6_9MUSC|nr:neural cell adhesion molecule 2 [Glossina fuscipes]XP_037883864.1 neural cell adhesion molecule 2 [Glossina fuscipes]XP_037883865.1 neural cell adhesion molecule 2 [Glossina fuscipes]XP_037883866.1 neural cell adhesion molecule 2 [Glossina fuscipes]
MDLLTLLLCFLLTPKYVAVWGQESGNVNPNSSSNGSGKDNGANGGNTSGNSNSNSLLKLRPSTPSITHFVNDSFIIFCTTITQKDIDIKWKDSSGAARENTKGRVHIEKKAGLLALVFEHIALADKGNWTCEALSKETRKKERKSFELLVNQKISFDSTEMVQSAREGRDATVYCLVKGDPSPEISWLFNGEYINTANSSKHKKLSDGLFIKNVTQQDAGEYTCRAMRITPTFSDSDQITILLRIQHKPHWFDNDTALLQYSFVGGSVNISCDAMGEPPPSFTWLHDGHGISGSNYRWFYADYGSTLQIHVRNDSHFGDYKCKVANPLGILERIIKLRKGQKPIGPSRFQLKRAFTDGLELDIRSVKFSSVPDNMQTIGYRVEYMSENEFKYCAGNWSYAKRRDFLFHRDGRRFVVTRLQTNTTYLMRAASLNLAGLSDWSSVKIFATLTNLASHTVAQNFIIIIALGLISSASYTKYL